MGYKFSYSFVTFLFIFVFNITSCNTTENNHRSPVIQLKNGDLQGVTLLSRGRRQYYGFLGVPFGEIPQRFSIAEPVKPWKGLKIMDTLPPPCVQFDMKLQTSTGIEDCLMLNIYTPMIDASFPVLVWLFPGGFQVSGASSYEAKYFMDQDVVLVSINYRLGAMGFLDTSDGTILGNMGLKDQVLAMQWVKENIKQFGGDPSSITLIGMSAGASSVNYHVLSPMSQGLFHKAIAQSGSALSPWALQYKPRQLFEKFSAFCGCTRNSTSQTISCLREKPAEEILRAQNKCFESAPEFNSLAMQFVPTIEYPESSSANDRSMSNARFIQEHPYLSMKTGKVYSKVPYLTSFTNNEGAFDTAFLFTSREKIKKLNDEWDQVAPNMLYLKDVITDPLDLQRVTRSIRQHYFGSENITWENKQIVADIISARSNNNGIIDSAFLLSPHQPVYTCVMNYEGQYSGIQFLFEGVKDKNKVAHADELLYMFNRTNGYPECDLGSEDGDFSEKYIRFLVSFATDGKPTWDSRHNWEPLHTQLISSSSPHDIQFYGIDLRNPQLVPDISKNERDFWLSLKLNENEYYKVDKLRRDEL